MGRELNAIGNEVQTGEPHGYYPFDFFKYSAAEVRSLVGTTQGYFSPDGGVTNLDNFNADSDDDFGDWAASAGNDAFRAFSDSGVVNAVTATDIVVMDVIGWNAAPGSPGVVALFGNGGGVAIRGGDGASSPPPINPHQAISDATSARLGHDLSSPAASHVGGTDAPPVTTAGFLGHGDWHLV